MSLLRASPLPPAFSVIGHAIVSADGMIASADGSMPEDLRIDADWQAFQAALDKSALVVLGRKGHARHPNSGRPRLVVTGAVQTLAQDRKDPMAHFWNPANMAFADLLEALQIRSGDIAITGGQGVFDYFTPALTTFMLSEVHDLVLPDGVACFSGGHPRQVLARAGLMPAHVRPLGGGGDATATLWQ